MIGKIQSLFIVTVLVMGVAVMLSSASPVSASYCGMQANTAVYSNPTVCSNYQELYVKTQDDAGACGRYCNSKNADSCEWGYTNHDCYPEFWSSGCYPYYNTWGAGGLCGDTQNAQYISTSPPPSTMTTDQKATVSVTMKNTGNSTWTPDSLHRLGSQSLLDNGYWGTSRVDLSTYVFPGDSYTFTFTITAPSTPGTYSFRWRMVQEAWEWFGDYSENYSITVNYPPLPTPSVSPPNSSCTPGNTSNMYTISWGSAFPAVTYVDISTDNFASWYNKAVSGSPTTASDGFTGMPGTSVAGQTLTFQPKTDYSIRLWNGQLPHSSTTTFTTPAACVNDAQFVSRTCPTSLITGQTASIPITMKNTGNTTWTKANLYRLGDIYQVPPLYHSDWGGRILLDPTDNILPGASHTFTWTGNPPATPGTYNFQWKMVQDGVEWFGALTDNCSITVTYPQCDSGTCTQCYAELVSCPPRNGKRDCTYDHLAAGGNCVPRTVYNDPCDAPNRCLPPKSCDVSGSCIDNLLANTQCPTQTSNARAEGLISTPLGATNFGNSTGQCVVDTKASFSYLEIPDYETLKSKFYDQAKTPPKVPLPITSMQAASGDHVYTTSTDLTISGFNPPIIMVGTQVIFVEGDLYIDGDIKYHTNDGNGGLVFVVQGNVIINKDTVTEIDAVIISSGKIYTAGDLCTTSSVNVGTKKLTVYGSLISIYKDQSTARDCSSPIPQNPQNCPDIRFCRNLDDNSEAAEKINQQAKYLVLLRDLFAETLQKWEEIQ